MQDTFLDLHDIQGNIVKAYGRYGFPKGRYLFLEVCDAERARAFVLALAPSITTSAPWRMRDEGATAGAPIPACATNVAFTYHGLRELGVPRASLQTFPDEFAMGMRARCDILGDDARSAPACWDPIWRRKQPVDVMISVVGQDDACLGQRHDEIVALIDASGGGVKLLGGHRGADGAEDLSYQSASAIYVGGQPTAKEHFGYTDGIGDPFFKGTYAHASNLIGNGKVVPGYPASDAKGWAPLETGEFLLGYKDEALESPEAPSPKLLAHNGTFMVYRKLHQNVGAFDAYLQRAGSELPGGKEWLAAKLAGRWRNGAPLVRFPTEREADAFAARWEQAKQAIRDARDAPARTAAKARFSALNAQFAAFDYDDDQAGARCPMGAHIRRAHPRSALAFGDPEAFETPDALSNRRRIIRRGLPYGDATQRTDHDEHGIIFMALGASIRRQFEFVQQQWMNYGNDFRLGNDRDPLVGNHPTDEEGRGAGSMVIPSPRGSGKAPFFCSRLPRFVETRGGDYFFVPSLTALRMIGEGSIDPT
ncbi:MAG: peroxidase [Polyangiales bacterium]